MPERVNTGMAPRSVRCAIYTRKSSEEGLEQEFNSLHAQREAAEAFILSQRQEGWLAVPDRYDDGGFTGGNMVRPALRKLMSAIEAGRIDCVVVYKVDRLSRSLLDFARMMGVFEQHGVSFVSVTQQFNTSVPVGRLTLNILLSFAQFEREIISDRTRDKLSAARQKGKWTGGYLVLGYDLDPRRGRLVVNQGEARQVRSAYQLFAKNHSVETTLAELQRRGWLTKTWVTKKGKRHAGATFSEGSLVRLLANPLYKGCIRHKGKLYPAEHTAIVDHSLWDQVQELLHKAPMRMRKPRNKHGAPLKGLLRCAGCGDDMVATYGTARGRRYHYYVCRRRAKPCPNPRVPAAVIEPSVLQQITVLAEKPEREEVRKLLNGYGPSWQSLSQYDQLRLLLCLIETVIYDGATGGVRIRLRRERQEHG
jgi:site-specific DNA recombinase